jgi:hypothetical protein
VGNGFLIPEDLWIAKQLRVFCEKWLFDTREFMDYKTVKGIL